MEFSFDKDKSLFDVFFKENARYTPEALSRDIEGYYLPFIERLIKLRGQRHDGSGLVVGISAIQGAGKTTQGQIMEILLRHFGYSSCSLSIDDHYLTHRDLVALRREDARYIRRGVTHDISLATEDLDRLKKMREGQPILVAGYDKGPHHGDGDRFRWVNLEPGLTLRAKVADELLVIDKQERRVKALRLVSAEFEGHELWLPQDMGSDIPVLEGFLPAALCEFLGGEDDVLARLDDEGHVRFEGRSTIFVASRELPRAWRLVTEKPAFIFYDGWMLGAFPVTDESVFEGDLPGLETEESRRLAKDINVKLGLYEPLWGKIDFLSILYVPNYHNSLLWREQAEEALRAKGHGMTSEEIREFVYYFWRSVHPAVHIKNLAHSAEKTQQVVIIDDDRSIKEVLTPEQARMKYA